MLKAAGSRSWERESEGLRQLLARDRLVELEKLERPGRLAEPEKLVREACPSLWAGH